MEGRHLRLLARALELEVDGVPLERLCRAFPALLDVTSAAVAVLGPSGAGGVIASSGEIADTHVALHLELGEGPGYDAVRDEVDVHVASLAADEVRWPVFAPAARQLGVEAAFALPAQLGGIQIGVLLLHRDVPGPLSRTQRETAGTAVELCTALLLDRARPTPAIAASPAQLADWPDRAVVHQATGMVAVQTGGDLAQALARLRAYAFSNGITLDVVARSVVDRQLTFER